MKVVTFKATSKNIKEEMLNKLDDLHSRKKRGQLNNSRAKEQNLLRLLCSDMTNNENSRNIDERYQYLSSIK